MSKTKSYQLGYQVDAEDLQKVIMLSFEILNETGMEPKSFSLPDGSCYSWNGYAAHQYAGEGRINEKQFLEQCKKLA